MVIGGRPGISITCEPDRRRATRLARRRWGRCRRNAVAGLDGDDRARDRLPVGGGPDDLAVLRAAVDEAACSATWKPESFKR